VNASNPFLRNSYAVAVKAISVQGLVMLSLSEILGPATQQPQEALTLTREELVTLVGVSMFSFAQWQSGKRPLESTSSDRLLRCARLYALAQQALDDREAAMRWLREPQPALGGAIPLQLARTEIGTRAVSEVLGTMAVPHGVEAA
jgi:putative toxin-antitoxin system antitoxin component (TIGR02293 family)